MNDESKDELRERLLGDEEIRGAISRRAYEIYQQRGGEPGREMDDWLQAENEILAEEGGGDLPSAAPTAPLTPPTAEAEKSPPRPPAAKKSKSRTASKSSAPRKKKIKVEQTAAAEEKATKKSARLVKRRKPANERPA